MTTALQVLYDAREDATFEVACDVRPLQLMLRFKVQEPQVIAVAGIAGIAIAYLGG